MATLPSNVGLETSLNYVTRPTNTFLIDWASKQISGMNEGLPAMRQAVEIILQNERFRWQIYSSNFGSELEDLPGDDAEYIESEFPRRVRDAFSLDERIIGAKNFVFARNGETLTISFDVETVYGELAEEVSI